VVWPGDEARYAPAAVKLASSSTLFAQDRAARLWPRNLVWRESFGSRGPPP